jgi:hypothetical protein
MYFEGGISSVYLWDLDEDAASGKEMAFAGAVVLKKGQWGNLRLYRELIRSVAAAEERRGRDADTVRELGLVARL